MKPRVLLVAPTKYYYRKTGPEPVKYYLLTLLSHLADIASVEILDFETAFGYPQSDAAIRSFLGFAQQRLRRNRPDLVGISCYTSFDYLCVVDLLRLCARLYPHAVTVVGGHHATAMPSDFTEADVPVDYVVRGEGELPLEGLVNGAGRGGPTVIDGTPLAPDAERPLRPECYGASFTEISLALSRGCPFRCSFCVQSAANGQPYRHLSLEQVRDALRRLAYHLPLRRVYFSDAFFGAQPDYTRELLVLLKAEFPGLKYWAETRVDGHHDRWIREAAALGIYLNFGVESLAPDTLRVMRKSSSPSTYVDSFLRTIRLCQDAQIVARYGFIMNFPGEEPESYRTTLNGLRRAVSEHDPTHFGFQFNAFALYPGSAIYDQRKHLADSRGFICGNDGWWRERKPDVRARSRASIASAAIAKVYGMDPGFWKKDAGDLARACSSRWSQRAFCYFRREELLEVLCRHYSSEVVDGHEETRHPDALALLRAFRYHAMRLYAGYNAWLAGRWPWAQQSFSRLFNDVVEQQQTELLRACDARAPTTALLAEVDRLNRVMTQELRLNRKRMCQVEARQPAADGGGDIGSVDLHLLGHVYRLSIDGGIAKQVREERRAACD